MYQSSRLNPKIFRGGFLPSGGLLVEKLFLMRGAGSAVNVSEIAALVPALAATLICSGALKPLLDGITLTSPFMSLATVL